MTRRDGGPTPRAVPSTAKLSSTDETSRSSFVPPPLASSLGGQYRAFSKYRLIARLGSGGMAEVFLAVTGNPRGFSKLQVLKVLRPDLPEQERADFVRMFQDEGRLAARLSHPNIVQSYEVGSEEGHDFIAMEYLEGQRSATCRSGPGERNPASRWTCSCTCSVWCWRASSTRTT